MTRENVSPTGSMRTRSAGVTRGVSRGLDREDDVLLVQHLVVLEAVHQRGRRALRIAGEEDRGARARAAAASFPGWRPGVRAAISSRRVFSNSSRLPRRHVYITIITHAAERERHPAALDHLEQVGGQEGEIDEEERHDQRGGAEQRPAPHPPDHDEGHHRR